MSEADDTREPTLAELCRPLSAKVQPKDTGLLLRHPESLTPRQVEHMRARMARSGRRSGSHG